MKNYAWILSLLLGASLLVAGCGSGGGDDSVGQFLDSPVAGLYYYIYPDNVLVTNQNGEFDYRPESMVSFFVGDPDIAAIPLGVAMGADIVTPCDLTGATDELDSETTNISILLQSLDADGNPANGIEITAAISAEVQAFLAGLQAAADQHPGSVCYISGADFAHVGQRFGDQWLLDENRLARQSADDRRLLEAVCHCDSAGFFSEVARQEDRSRICGLAPTYVMLKLIDSARGELLKYHQAVEPDGTSCVSFASVAFYQE